MPESLVMVIDGIAGNMGILWGGTQYHLNRSGTEERHLLDLPGGGSDDSGNSIAVDPNGYAYVVGTTASPDFPVTSGAIQKELTGGQDIFCRETQPGR